MPLARGASVDDTTVTRLAHGPVYENENEEVSAFITLSQGCREDTKVSRQQSFTK